MANPHPARRPAPGPVQPWLFTNVVWCSLSLLCLSHTIHLVPRAHSKACICLLFLRPWICEDFMVKNHWLTEFCTIAVSFPSMKIPAWWCGPLHTYRSRLAFNIANSLLPGHSRVNKQCRDTSLKWWRHYWQNWITNKKLLPYNILKIDGCRIF